MPTPRRERQVNLPPAAWYPPGRSSGCVTGTSDGILTGEIEE